MYQVETNKNEEAKTATAKTALNHECIDFTMIITSRNNAPISNFGGGFRWRSEYPWCIIKIKSKHFPTAFKKIEKNQKKSDRKTGIFTQNQFSTISIFLYGCNSKTNHCKYLKFSQNVYVSVIYIHVDKKILDEQKINLIQVQTFTRSLKNHKIVCCNDFAYLKISPLRAPKFRTKLRSFQQFSKNWEKKSDEETGHVTQNQFSTKSIFSIAIAIVSLGKRSISKLLLREIH
ncbi:Uncharacterized protein FWK35_00002575 [Aphis craccivora]|uniref:Uncharacterized protein n=1 Tax=Aphis craccivora TaxID=307492 RepID=A0A6G0ZF29_APHCR|nr:Uncharacterized protein FWK35_00002575 [Aphis craccivora]